MIIYVDNEEVFVPIARANEWEARGIFGLRRDEQVVLQHRMGNDAYYSRIKPIDLRNGWSFHPEDHYIVITNVEAQAKEDSYEPWEADPEAWKP